MYGRARRIHFIGIGGSGMSGLAEVLLTMGYTVSGSDLKTGEVTDRLVEAGGRVFAGHHERNVEGANIVVYSSAVRADNPELRAAIARGLPVIPRAEMLAELMRMKYGVAVAGAHGKTTTTSMVGAVLLEGGLDPTIVVGGRVHALGTNARLGHGQFLVAEADESDGSFVRLSPAIGVITNLDREHLDHYGTIAGLESAFLEFAERIPFYGLVVLCADDPALAVLMPRISRRVATYGIERGGVRAKNLELMPHGSRFTVEASERVLGEIEVPVVGRHNVLNALAAVTVGIELEIPFAHVALSLSRFEGVGRRFESKGEAADVLVVDDYAHHPTEIIATLSAARQLGRPRIVVVFQPHRYSRTRALAADFGAAFDAADHVLVTDIYPAGETPIEGVSAELIVGAARSHGHRNVVYAGDLSRAEALLRELVRPHDLVLTLGAGDITKLGDRIVSALANAPREVRR
ncbi:MAG: UDP-N-acetylmuramate--L-alanine ligase [Candidatus Eiseniibacteriota bacterium]